MDVTSITPTAHQLKALTHPVRLRMLGLLRVEGPATATTLATRLGLNTGATSYHLRQLHQHGFLEDARELGNARERWWRAAHAATRTEQPSPDDLDAAHGMDAYLQAVVSIYTSQLQQAMQERPLLPQPWREASAFSNWNPRLTPRRARELVDMLDRFVSEVDDEDDDEAAVFVVQLNAYPRPGATTSAPS
ncbi:MAG: helix-turn-helix domain-containing protein [Nocardioides sp.]|nr:helix-turn-helix domain-containing protein [Nocardioides sp.]